MKKLILRGGRSPIQPRHGRFLGIWERLGEDCIDTLEELVLEYSLDPYYLYFTNDAQNAYDHGLSVVRASYALN